MLCVFVCYAAVITHSIPSLCYDCPLIVNVTLLVVVRISNPKTMILVCMVDVTDHSSP